MSVSRQFLATDGEWELVLDWFRALPHDLAWSPRENAHLIFFRNLGTLPIPPDQADQDKTPLVWIHTPHRLRGVLWTSGSVTFTPSPLRGFPKLQSVSKAFQAWLQQFPLVFSRKAPQASEHLYYLEGGIQNFHDELYALPRAFAALKNGQYFVNHDHSERSIDVLCKTLRLRGIPVEPVA